MIKFAVMTFMYDRWASSEDGSHQELIDIVAASGAEGIEAFCNTFMGNAELLALYKKYMLEAGLKMPVMDLLANLACSDKAQRGKEYDKMRMGIDICEAFDSEIVHVAGCYPPEVQSLYDSRKFIAEGLSDFVDDVERRGMVLAFEDFDPAPSLICSADDCLEIIELADDRVKFVFDTGNFEAAGQHAEDVFGRLENHICHFHFKDFSPDENGKLCVGSFFGNGSVKNQEIADFAQKNNYSGWVALESYMRDAGPRETLANEMAVLKSMFRK